MMRLLCNGQSLSGKERVGKHTFVNKIKEYIRYCSEILYKINNNIFC